MRIVPAGNGWIWLNQGWMLFRRFPAEWILLILFFLLASGVINWIPAIGPYLASILIPGFSVGLMLACAGSESSRAPHPRVLIVSFRHSGKPLITLGALYLLGMLLTLAASSSLDGGALMQQMLFGTPPPETALKDGSYVAALALTGLLAMPMLMAFWFSPLLVSWRDLGVAQALFYSFFASLRNWRAFFVYGLVLFAGLMAASLGIAMLGVTAGAGVAAMRGAMLGLAVVMMPAVTCSFYYSFQDIFPPDDANTVNTPGALETQD
jgi:hypothetical protein